VVATPDGAGGARITVSLGVSDYTDAIHSEGQLIEAADQMLYAAKAGGRNRVVAFGDNASLTAASTPSTT